MKRSKHNACFHFLTYGLGYMEDYGDDICPMFCILAPPKLEVTNCLSSLFFCMKLLENTEISSFYSVSTLSHFHSISMLHLTTIL